jgi:hypothetical protein
VITTLRDGRLYALINPYVLDGRASSHPVHMRGWTTMNCYLLVEDSRAVLFNTGYSSHQDTLIVELKELVGNRTLDLVVPRVEFPSMCNARPIADQFDVGTVYQRVKLDPSSFLNFRPELRDAPYDGLRDVDLAMIETNKPIAVGEGTDRRLTMVLPHLRLLPCTWGYDAETRTLFTGDMFGWVVRDGPDGPWLLDGHADDPVTVEHVYECLVYNRYWWLPGAETTELRSRMSAIFEDYEIETIAPDHGAVLVGDAVTRHRELLDQVLARVESEPSVGLAAGHWSITGGSR